MKFIKPLTFNPFTFSRDSAAKYLDASGDYVDAAPDVLRLGYGYDIDTDSLVFAGSIIEDLGFNYIPDSNDFTGSNWRLTGTPSPTITPDYSVSPDGTNNAALFTPGGLGTQNIYATPLWGNSGGLGLFSVFIKAVAGGTSVRLTLGTSTSVFRVNTDDWEAFETFAYITPFPNGWFRCEIYGSLSSPTDKFYPQISALSGSSFLMYGAQLEVGVANISFVKRATSYVHQDKSSIVDISGTSVTRVSGANFTDYSPGQNITVSLGTFYGVSYDLEIDSIADANNMTVTTSWPVSAEEDCLLAPRTYRSPDIVVDQTPSLITSNIAEDDADVWDGSEPYTVGERVMVLGEYHRVYEALTNHSNKFPPDFIDGESPYWLDTGATNRWRMFDMQVGAEKQSLSTASSGDIDVLMSVESYVTSAVLLNASGVTATVIMRNSLNEIIYERSVDLLGTAMGIGWWEFFFGYRNGIKTIVLTDLPKIAPATIQVTIDGGGGISGLGKLIIGEAIEIGCTKFGTTVGIIDFSRKERDAFGNNYILQRRYIDKVDYDIQIDSDKVDDIKDILADVRSTPAVYIGSESKFRSTVVFGFYRDFSIVIEGSRKSKCAISVEGI